MSLAVLAQPGDVIFLAVADEHGGAAPPNLDFRRVEVAAAVIARIDANLAVELVRRVKDDDVGTLTCSSLLPSTKVSPSTVR